MFGTTYDGFNVDIRRTFTPSAPGISFLLDLETSLGQVEVTN
ncbi:MAG: hypothetical protein ACXVDS_04710 [Actinomycetota bacterium]